MRIDVLGPDGQQYWFEVRAVSELTGGDEEAWGALIAAAREKQVEANANAPEGAPEAPLRMPAGWIKKRMDDLLASLITAWSFSDPASVPHVELPYSKDARLVLPLDVLHAMRDAIEPHITALNGDSGPKEPPAPTSTTNGSGSSSDSKERSENGLPVSVPEALPTA